MKWDVRRILLAGLSVASLAVGADENLHPAQVPVPATYFGMHFHRAATSTRIPREGIGSWRLWDARVAWRYLADKGPTIDFRPLDQLVSLARERRIDLLYTLGATPTWASARPQEKGPYGPGSAAEPRAAEDLNDFVRRVARRYKGQISNYEIWNEPNGGFFTGSVQSLVDISCSAASVLKSIDPQITVVSPSVVGGYPNNLQWLDDFLAHGGARCVDVIAHHIYAAHSTPESMLGTLRGVQKILTKYHVADKPLWNTESGWRLDLGPSKAPAIDPHWPKIDAVLSPAYVARALLIGWAGGLQRYYWYSWDHLDMGFLQVDGQASPSATAYLAMEGWMRGAVVHECASKGVVWQCTLTRDGATYFIVWSEDTASHVIPVPASVASAETLAGAHRMLDVGGSMDIGPQPLRLMP